MYDNDFNLDDILNEFSDSPAPAEAKPAKLPSSERKQEKARFSEELPEQPRTENTSAYPSRDSIRNPQRRPDSALETDAFSRRTSSEEAREPRGDIYPSRRRRDFSSPDIMDISIPPRGRDRQSYSERGCEPAERRLPEVSSSSRFFGGLLFLAVLFGVFMFLLINIHPNTNTVKTENAQQLANLTSRFENLANNLASDAMSDITYIKKVYSIPEDASVAPRPAQTGFGESSDPAVIQGIIDSAAELLEGQGTVWNPNIVTYNNTPVQYYYDDTILSLVWKEVVGNTVFTFSEIKIADGSQLRRSLAGDAYSSSIQLKASDMAATVNAVTAMNGDFYAFRQVGIVVYKRNLERFEPSTLDSCFFTSTGDMIFAHRGELTSEEDTRQFIEDNDVVFSTSFGPILVENGELYKTKDYPIGEIFTKYARSAIGMTGERHYLLLATSSEKDSGYLAGVYVSTAGEIMFNKGCIMAYELDGGQTAVIIHNNNPANEIVYGSERTMSDIIYFATAIPEREG